MSGMMELMKNKVEKTGLLEDFSGELHPGILARIPLLGSTNAHEGETFSYVRKGCTNHLIVMFNGGGMSWNEESARYDINPEATMTPGKPTLYSPKVDVMTEFSTFGLTSAPGILTPGKKNLFSEWNVVVINYVTGDAHVGRNDFPYTDEYGTEKILHHQGYRNFRLAMEACKKFFPAADKLLIMGGSAGAFAVPALAAEVMDFYPDCEDVTVYSDSATMFFDGFHEAAKNVWKAEASLVEAIQTDNLCADWYRRLYAMKGDSIRYLFSNSYQDFLFATFQNYIDSGEFIATGAHCKAFTKQLKRHVERLRQECPQMGFYIFDHRPIRPGAVGTEHGICNNAGFLKSGFRRVSAMQWLHDGVSGAVYDVGLHLLDK